MEGFWIVQFEGIEGGGGGVAVLLRSKVYGGDGAYHYTGTYTAIGSHLAADVFVHQFLEGIGNVLGVEGDFRLNLAGELVNGSIKGTATLVGAPGAGMAFKLTKVSEIAE
jgi:hypothetical protein